MEILILIAIMVAFVAFTGLVFSLLTLLLDAMGVGSFALSGPDQVDASAYFGLYWRNCVIAAVWTFVFLPSFPCLGLWLGGLVGLGALTLAYKLLFQAGFTQAAIMGFGGGVVAIVCWILLFRFLLLPLELMSS